jgi:hypothetical protein
MADFSLVQSITITVHKQICTNPCLFSLPRVFGATLHCHLQEGIDGRQRHDTPLAVPPLTNGQAVLLYGMTYARRGIKPSPLLFTAQTVPRNGRNLFQNVSRTIYAP